MEEQNNTTQKPGNTPAPEGKNKSLLYGTIAVVILLGLAAGYLFMTDSAPNDLAGNGTNTGEEATGPVAVVNGEEVSRDTYNETLTQFQSALSGQGASDEEIRQQALEAVVNNTLLRQQVASEGIVASETEVQAEYDRIVDGAGGAEALAGQLESIGLTDADLREQLAQQLAVNAYVESAADLGSITVTDEEVNTYYEELSAQNESMPPLEQIRARIEQQLRLQKEQAQVEELVAELRANADIEVLL